MFRVKRSKNALDRFVSAEYRGKGGYVVTFEYRNKYIKGYTTDTESLDSVKDYRGGNMLARERGANGLTPLQSAEHLYHQIKRANGLN